MNQISFTQQLNPIQQEQVATLYYEGLTLKVKYLWFHTKTQKQALQLLVQSFQFEQGIYALQNEEVVGFIGFNLGKRPFTPAKYKAFQRVFPPFVALYRYYSYKSYLKSHLFNEKVLHIDPIVVSEKARGMGIGTLLLREVEGFAKQQKITKLCLEVVDTNPLAHKLYERIGFTVTKEKDNGSSTKLAGFEKVYYMRKILE